MASSFGCQLKDRTAFGGGVFPAAFVPLLTPRKAETSDNGGMKPGLLKCAVESVRSRPARNGSAVKVVAIDGPGGAGKSSLARYLAAELAGVPILATDDFASWENPVDWWPDMIERALEPLAAGKPAHFTPSSWGGNGKDPVTIEPAELVIIEGVSSSRKEFRPYLTYVIWVDAPAELRLERGLERGGENTRAQWKRWMADEDAFFSREKLREKADLILRGDQDDWT